MFVCGNSLTIVELPCLYQTPINTCRDQFVGPATAIDAEDIVEESPMLKVELIKYIEVARVFYSWKQVFCIWVYVRMVTFLIYHAYTIFSFVLLGLRCRSL